MARGPRALEKRDCGASRGLGVKVKFSLPAKSRSCFSLVGRLIWRRFCHFQYPAHMNAQGACADLVQELEQFFVPIPCSLPTPIDWCCLRFGMVIRKRISLNGFPMWLKAQTPEPGQQFIHRKSIWRHRKDWNCCDTKLLTAGIGQAYGLRLRV